MWHTPRFPDGFSFPARSRPDRLASLIYRRRSAVFRLERLEERTVLSTLIVTSGAR